jgi:hypothetical protein
MLKSHESENKKARKKHRKHKINHTRGNGSLWICVLRAVSMEIEQVFFFFTRSNDGYGRGDRSSVHSTLRNTKEKKSRFFKHG